MTTRIINGEPVDISPFASMATEFIDPEERNRDYRYEEFLRGKQFSSKVSGLTEIPPLHEAMFLHQRDVTTWALRLGKAAIFLGTGLGKTLIELEWARIVSGHCGKPVLILAPLAVALQFEREAEKFGIEASYQQQGSPVTQIVLTNYERLDKFDPAEFGGVSLDESSILKSFSGATRSRLIESFCDTPYRLCATATPAPNDHMELGNHAEFLGVMTASEMLSMFFVHDGGETQKWRLKGHARKAFWEWVCSWALSLRKPSDAGYSDEGFVLPPLIYHEHVVNVDTPSEGMLFAMPAETLSERIGARRSTVDDRVAECVKIVQGILTCEESSLKKSAKSTCVTNKSASQTIPNTENRIGQTTAKLASHNTGKRLKRDTEAKQWKVVIPSSESDMHSMPITEVESLTSQPRTDTESASSDTRKCTFSSADYASSANYPQINQADDCASITVTKPEGLEDCYAACATSALEDSRIGQNYSPAQSYTSKTQVIVWCNLNAEQDELKILLGDDAVSIYGSLSQEEKLERYRRFEDGLVPVLLTKSSIFGYGINMQFCSRQIFVGVTDSWESFYQATRRLWRFRQIHPVHVHIISASTEGNVSENLKRKEREAGQMAEEMAANMQDLTRMHLRGTEHASTVYLRDVKRTDDWEMHMADCVDLAHEMPSNSGHYSIYSPPFQTMYTYSDSLRDLGNARSPAEFWKHYKFLIAESYRVMMPGRLVSIHCMTLPTSKVRDGVIGLIDFRGEIIRAFQDVGFIYHSEVCIWKDPVTAMQRTKALGLLHKTIRKNSAMGRQGIPDYLVTMRKPGDNPERIAHSKEEFPVELWQQYASPVWMDINPSDTLQYRSAREHTDERHIAPLQLEVIRRAVKLWSNPRDVVWDPFAGIGSTGFVALEMGRRFIGSELKKSYWEQSCRNLAAALSSSHGLFASAEKDQMEDED